MTKLLEAFALFFPWLSMAEQIRFLKLEKQPPLSSLPIRQAKQVAQAVLTGTGAGTKGLGGQGLIQAGFLQAAEESQP